VNVSILAYRAQNASPFITPFVQALCVFQPLIQCEIRARYLQQRVSLLELCWRQVYNAIELVRHYATFHSQQYVDGGILRHIEIHQGDRQILVAISGEWVSLGGTKKIETAARRR